MKHIVFTIDSKFTRFCAVTMASVLKHNDGSQIQFHIVTDNLPDLDRQILVQLAIRFKVHFYNVPEEKIKGYQVKAMSHRISVATFYRCMLPSILPPDISKVLYLDSDVLVLDSIEELWQTNLDGVALAGTEDSCSKEEKFYERLCYPMLYNYVNAGVLLLNLDYWRTHNLEDKCREYYFEHLDKMLYNDQDLLNALLYDKKKVLPVRWNVQDGFYRDMGKVISAEWKCAYSHALLHPGILHYTNRKPWEYHCMHPLRQLFYQYQDFTSWKGQSVLNNIGARMHRFVHLLPYMMGLKRRRYFPLDAFE